MYSLPTSWKKIPGQLDRGGHVGELDPLDDGEAGVGGGQPGGDAVADDQLLEGGRAPVELQQGAVAAGVAQGDPGQLQVCVLSHQAHPVSGQGEALVAGQQDAGLGLPQGHEAAAEDAQRGVSVRVDLDARIELQGAGDLDVAGDDVGVLDGPDLITGDLAAVLEDRRTLLARVFGDLCALLAGAQGQDGQTEGEGEGGAGQPQGNLVVVVQCGMARAL
jgi:hypothetical protein